METHEFVDEGLGHSSYLVNFDGQALVIDPPRFPTAIEELARRLDTRVTWTADTHSHADYVTGSPALTTSVDLRVLEGGPDDWASATGERLESTT